MLKSFHQNLRISKFHFTKEVLKKMIEFLVEEYIYLLNKLSILICETCNVPITITHILQECSRYTIHRNFNFFKPEIL